MTSFKHPSKDRLPATPREARPAPGAPRRPGALTERTPGFFVREEAEPAAPPFEKEYDDQGHELWGSAHSKGM